MLTPAGGVSSVALEGSQHLLVAVGKPHTFDYQVLVVLPQPGSSAFGAAGSASRYQQQLATQSWQPAVSSRLPSTKNSSLRASRQSLSHS